MGLSAIRSCGLHGLKLFDSVAAKETIPGVCLFRFSRGFRICIHGIGP
jgi:hypothetical protein